MDEDAQSPQVTIKELYQRFNILTGVISTLMQYGEHLLVLAEQHPECDPLAQLLETLQRDLIAASLCRDQTMEAANQFWHNLGSP